MSNLNGIFVSSVKDNLSAFTFNCIHRHCDVFGQVKRRVI